MFIKTTDFKLIQSLLYEDELVNSPMIRLLDTPEIDVEIWLDRDPRSNGILFLQKPCPGTWDAAQQPSQWYRVWVQAFSDLGLDRLIGCLPPNQEFLFKLHRPWVATHLKQRLPLTCKQALLYFTVSPADHIDRQRHEVTQLTVGQTYQMVELLKHSGRSTDNLQQEFARDGAAVFGIFRDGQFVSGAYVDPRTKRTQEICAVYTCENYRGQGFAASVVSVATRYILEQGKLPVYACRMTNRPSIRLAQSMGYKEYGRVNHYYCPGL